jgi:hypothetical protein
VAINRRLYAELRALDRHDLRRIAIFVGGLLAAAGDDPASTKWVTGDSETVTYRRESVRCGKLGCTTCPHGPYWYAYYREGGRLRSRYIGKELPAGVAAPSGSTASGRLDE